MARTIDDIFLKMQIELRTAPTLKSKLLNPDGTTTLNTEQNLLDSLTSNSKVSIWSLFFYTVSVVIWSVETLWDRFKISIEDIKSSAFVGTLNWWEDKSELFQYGDLVIIDPDNYSVKYDVIDDTKQIVEHCAATESGGIVNLKIRRKSTDILSVPEMDAFQSYIQKIKFAGTRTVVYNLNADDLKIYYDIYYDPIKDITNLQTLVEDAINNYIENIPFNGELDINELNVILKAIAGVKAVKFQSGYGKNASDPYIAFDNYYQSVAGYCVIDSSFPLSGTINYIKRYK